MFCATVCGTRGYEAISDWAQQLSQTMRKRLGCTKRGESYLVPSRSTFYRFINAIDPCKVDTLLGRWRDTFGGEVRVAGYQDVAIPRKGNRAVRTAKLAVRFAAVLVQPPQRKALPPVPVWAVYAREVASGPEGTAPLEWMLVTTADVTTFTDACERLGWYARRWGIEVYHRTVKSGCRIEDRQLNTVARLKACLAIDLVVA